MKRFYVVMPLLFIGLLLSCRPPEVEPELPMEEPIFDEVEQQILHWIGAQQLPNGLLPSVEKGNVVSLYDNALAALVFMLHKDYSKAERIFDQLEGQMKTELQAGVGGFSQFRDSSGHPGNHRWMGDNAWLLIALNNYKDQTGQPTYDSLAQAISTWLQSLQDTDGGLFAGFNSQDNLLNYKVTEGMIDAFNAVDGYDDFHERLLDFLHKDRWDSLDQNLMAWPTNPPFKYALDLHPWSYLIFDQYPVSSLTSAARYLNTQTTIEGKSITGYGFDEDKDAVWLEGTGQMALAFHIAGRHEERDLYLAEMENALFQSSIHTNGAGFPYASNIGTSYGTDLLWEGADSKIAISGGAWYVFAKQGFNPFEVGKKKSMPTKDMFWIK